MLGAGVADRSGLFTALVRAILTAVPTRALIPVVMLTGMLTCHALDAGYIVFVPLAGIIFARAGRHPILGVAVASPAWASGSQAICCRALPMCCR